MYFDTHAHLDLVPLRDAEADVVRRERDVDVSRIVTIGIDPESSERAVEIAHRHAGVYAAVGLHPHDASACTDALIERLEIHYTPKHGSWLNMAEIELSVMERQCLRRRLPDELTLATELIAWERPRNDARVQIRWKFSTQDARRVFAQYYPASSNC